MKIWFLAWFGYNKTTGVNNITKKKQKSNKKNLFSIYNTIFDVFFSSLFVDLLTKFFFVKKNMKIYFETQSTHQKQAQVYTNFFYIYHFLLDSLSIGQFSRWFCTFFVVIGLFSFRFVPS